MAIRPGDVAHLRERDYQRDNGPLRPRITGVHLDISSRRHGQRVWLEGIKIRAICQAGRFRQVIVRIAAFPKPEA